MRKLRITIQKRANRFGTIKFRALILIQDRVIDGWGSTPQEAETALKNQLNSLIIALQRQNENNKTSE